MMNLLVTGGSGFVGSALIRRVVREPCVSCLVNLDRLSYAADTRRLEVVEGDEAYHFERADIRDPIEVLRILRAYRITHVIHVAAESHVDRSIANPGEFVSSNIVGTFNLLEGCRKVWASDHRAFSDMAPRIRFLHVSTDEVYGSLGGGGVFTEESPYAPNSPYSASKASSDLLVRAHHRTYDFPAVITHCSNNYGPYQFPEKLIPVVIKSCLERTPIPVYGDGGNVRDWIHVEDHCEALWRILFNGKIGEVYNVGGDEELDNLSLVRKMCDVYDELKGFGCERSRKLITFVEDRPGHDFRYSLDCAKIRREIGWVPHTPFEDGIRSTVQWYLENPEWLDLRGERALSGSHLGDSQL